MLQRKLIAIKSETKCVARMLDIAADDWVIDVCETPVIDCHAAG